MEKKTVGIPEENPYKSISILYRKSHIWLNSGCETHGITAAQASIILIVCDSVHITQDELTKRTGLDKSVVAKTVLKLEQGAYITRTPNPSDRRTYIIQPTDKAFEQHTFIQGEMDKVCVRMTGHMTQEEQAEFGRLLSKAAQGECGR